MKVYFDNAATTAIDEEVLETMMPYLKEHFGNPSTQYSFGRDTRAAVEDARKTIAQLINASPGEIVFTSGATEANNTAIKGAVNYLGVERIITSLIEHHCVEYSVDFCRDNLKVETVHVKIDDKGNVDLADLENLLKSSSKKTLVTLMHANNEIGTLLDIEKVGALCKEYHALFHSDMVQSIGKTEIDLQTLPIDFVVASAHKFHGPKGVGFAYVKKNSGLQPMFYGGEQEKGLRPGTEAVHQIAGMAKALEISYSNLEANRNNISELKKYLISQLEIEFPAFEINGNQEGIYTILNILLPFSEDKTAMILFHLDMKGIAVSRGSACQSGSVKPSHVLAEMLSNEDLKKPSLRISFSHFNTEEDIDLLIEGLKSI